MIIIKKSSVTIPDMKRNKIHKLLIPILLPLLCLTGGCGSAPGKESVPLSAVTSRVLLSGDTCETTVYEIASETEGPVLYVVGGTHGDETAAWEAAHSLIRRAREGSLHLACGTLYVLPEANAYGVAHEQRKTKDDYDLNRAYPGDASGKDAARIADAIFTDIKEKQPALVIDLHEAKLHTDGKDNLGNTIICNDMEPVGDLVMGLLTDSESGALALSAPLSLYASPPEGSLNKTVSEKLNIPVITVETFREEDEDVRVKNHLAVLGYILDAYGMNG